MTTMGKSKNRKRKNHSSSPDDNAEEPESQVQRDLDKSAGSSSPKENRHSSLCEGPLSTSASLSDSNVASTSDTSRRHDMETSGVVVEEEVPTSQAIMMDSRENVDKFLVAVRLHQQKDSDFDFDDVLGVLSHEELCSLWSSLQKYTTDCIFSLLTTPSTENLMQQDPGPRWSTTIQQP